MSWLYSRALVEEYLADTSSDGEQFAQLSGTPMPRAYCSPDKMTECCPLSRFGMTFAPLTDGRGKDLLMWYREDFLVRTSALPEKAQDSAESGQGFGLKCLGLLARFDPDSCSWRTPQLSLIEEEAESLQTLPRWGIAADGELWELSMLGPLIDETESGLLPTPAMTWPTPTVSGNYNKKGASKKSGDGLATAVTKWPTPTARNAKEGAYPSEYNRKTQTLAAQAGGELNPTWVEWLMGWPLGWTDLKPLGMDKCQQWLHSHLED